MDAGSTGDDAALMLLPLLWAGGEALALLLLQGKGGPSLSEQALMLSLPGSAPHAATPYTASCVAASATGTGLGMAAAKRKESWRPGM